jgi:hypothetical protein
MQLASRSCLIQPHALQQAVHRMTVHDLVAPTGRHPACFWLTCEISVTFHKIYCIKSARYALQYPRL